MAYKKIPLQHGKGYIFGFRLLLVEEGLDVVFDGHEGIDKLWVEVGSTFFLDGRNSLLKRPRFLIWSSASKGIEDVSDGDDSCA